MKKIMVITWISLVLISGIAGSANAYTADVKYFFQGLDIDIGEVFTDPTMLLIIGGNLGDQIGEILKPPKEVFPAFEQTGDIYFEFEPTDRTSYLVFVLESFKNITNLIVGGEVIEIPDTPDEFFSVPINNHDIVQLTTSEKMIEFRVELPSSIGAPIIISTISDLPDPVPNPVIPEPSTLILLGLGLVGFLGFRRWRKSGKRGIKEIKRFLFLIALVGITEVFVLSGTRPAFAQFDCSPVTEIPQVECQALVALYTSTDGDNWRANNNWLQTNTPCDWAGITCEAGHVTRLRIIDNYLNGSLPPEIGDLTNLQYLNLMSNQLSALPSEIGRLSNLQELHLEGNQLETLPPEVGSLPNLQKLHLDDNSLLTLPLEIGNIISLEELHLDHNPQLSGPLPANLVHLTALNSFHFDCTKVCMPQDVAFQSWLAGIDNVWGTGRVCGSAEIEVCNGDFEEGLGCWGRYHAHASIVPGRNGSGMRIQWLDPQVGVQPVVSLVLPGIFEASKTYEATIWFQADFGDTYQLSFGDIWHLNDPVNNPSGENLQSQTLTGNGEWQQLRVVVTPSRDERMGIALSSSNVGVTSVYDDLQVREIPTPSVGCSFSDYFVHDEYGGSPQDVDKTLLAGDDEEMCWNFSGANILGWAGWQDDAPLDTAEGISKNVKDNWTNAGGMMKYLWRWWLNGTPPPDLGEEWSRLTATDGGNHWEGYDFADYYYSHWHKNVIAAMKDYLHSGYGVSMRIYDSENNQNGGHALTVWGYRFCEDETVLGVWVTDSNDAEPPDLRLVPVSYTTKWINSTLYERKWRITDDAQAAPYQGWLIEGVQALKPQDSNSLRVRKAGTGTGNVVSTPAGIVCGENCVSPYPAGTPVTLSASPESGSSFVGWQGACTGTGNCTVTIDGKVEVVAIFDAIPGATPDTSTITALSEPGAIVYSGDVDHIPAGADTTLVFAPDNDHILLDVLVDGYSVGPVSQYTFTDTTANHTIEIKTIKKDSLLAITRKKCVELDQNGDIVYENGEEKEITCSPGNNAAIYIGDQVCDSECMQMIVPFTEGTALILKAVPDEDNTFLRWEVNGDPIGPENEDRIRYTLEDIFLEPVIGCNHS